MTAVRESNQGLAAKFNPCLLCAYEVDCDDIVDLSSDAARRVEGVDYDEIAAPWLKIFLAGDEPPQWALYWKLRGRGVAGVKVPSFAPGSSEDDKNLVLWRWGRDLPHRVEAFDPSGRLPQNQLSWD